MRDAGDGVYECEYHPMVPGKYTVAITWGGYAIPRRSADTPPPMGHSPLSTEGCVSPRPVLTWLLQPL